MEKKQALEAKRRAKGEVGAPASAAEVVLVSWGLTNKKTPDRTLKRYSFWIRLKDKSVLRPMVKLFFFVGGGG